MTTTLSVVPHKYYALDGLRGLAALVVVQMHAKWWFGGTYLHSGYLAVDFFFLLSGFVIAHAYDEKLKNTMSFREFIRVRLIRLYPLYALGIILTIILLLVRTGSVSQEQILYATTLLPDFSNKPLYWLVPASWSLAFELLINIIFALFHRQMTNICLLYISAFGLILLTYSAITFGSLDVGYGGKHIIGGFGRIMFSFCVGVLIYRHRFNLNIKFATIISFIVMMLLLGVNAPKHIKPWSDLFIVVFAMPALLVISASAKNNKFSIKILTVLGVISYPVYITHGAIIKIIDVTLKSNNLPQISSYGPALGAAIIVAICILSFYLDKYYDTPVRKLLMGRLRKHPEPFTAMT